MPMLCSFNGHPPLGVNATPETQDQIDTLFKQFQRAPTLGGECYDPSVWDKTTASAVMFQQAPTLGGECYTETNYDLALFTPLVSTGTHPWG